MKGLAGRTVLLHCVSSYPTPPERATLGAITALRNRFPEIAIGYSDHTADDVYGGGGGGGRERAFWKNI